MSDILLFNKDKKTLEFIKNEDTFINLYYLKYRIPNKNDIKEYLKTGKDKKIIDYVDEDTDEVIEDIKKSLSKVETFTPLYDAYTQNLYIIPRELIYTRVIYDYYRFPDKELIKTLQEKEKELRIKIKKLNKSIPKTKTDDQNSGEYEIKHKVISLSEKHHKLELMLEFLSSFDIDILQTTYIRLFYFSSNEVGKNITTCIRPSFLPHLKHINPYYTRSELINLALNMELIKPSDQYFSPEHIMDLCNKVKVNDIDAKTIMDHQRHIIEDNKIGIIQYYSLQGSFFMNQYMRNFVPYEYKNELLETNIKSMWELINSAPEFDKSYTLYRFIGDDSYLKHLKIGDVFIDPSFISTTRDPFYQSEVYKFGFILIKINIPAKEKGVGLCIETYSHFPEEQEIILPPLSKLRLDRKDENTPYYHTDAKFVSKVLTRYEFTYIGKEKIRFNNRPSLEKNNYLVNFLTLEQIETLTIYEKIKKFTDTYVNELSQFRTKIGEKEYDLITERYDSSSVYKTFYASTTNNGFSLYTIQNNYISFLIELGEDNNEPYMYANYYFRYAATNPNKEIKDLDFIDFLSRMAYYFQIKNIILYTEYSSCDLGKQLYNHQDIEIYRGGNYCVDFYNYFKSQTKRFQQKKIDIDTTEIKPQFSYYELDRLRITDPSKVLYKYDKDDLYQIYEKSYKTFFKENKYNLGDFYVWMVENQCVNLKFLVEKMFRLFNVNNPFEDDYYIIDALTYLYNRNLISEYPVFKQSKKQKDKPVSNEVPKNEYRLEFFRKRQTISNCLSVRSF